MTTATAEPLATAGADPGRRGRSRGAALLALRIGRRVAAALAVILSVLTVTFAVTHVVAPDPTSLYLGAAGNGFTSPAAEAAARAQVQAKLGLNGSLLHQYGRFISQIVHGDLGTSFTTGRPVSTDLLSRLPATAELAVYSLILGLAVGIVGGVLAAVRHERWFDRVSRFFAIGFMAMPQFWVGLMLLWLCFTQLHVAPGPVGRLPLGATPPEHVTGFYVVDALLTGQWSTAWQAIRQLALPVLTLGLGLAAPVFKIVRTSMLEALTSDYVRAARALGFGRRWIWFKYALKNGLLPLITILAGIIGFTFAGSVLVEGIFSWPGVGNYAYSAIQNSDFPAIQGFVVYSAVLYVVVYEVMNALYAVVDPRVRI
ncbi:MAG: ABC transporter permease [Solirubrobacteraceae bacterium]